MEAKSMRSFAFLVLALFLVGPLTVPGSATSPGPVVDAGDSQAVLAGEAFSLVGHVENAPPGAGVEWTAPSGCSLDDASSLATTATCADVGVKTFMLRLSGSDERDSVKVSVVEPQATELLRKAGSDAAGANGVPAHQYSFRVAAGTTRFEATLSYAGTPPVPADYDLVLLSPTAQSLAAAEANPETITVNDPAPGFWTARANPATVVQGTFELVVTAHALLGDSNLPRLEGKGASAPPGTPVTLTAAPVGGTSPYSIAWETTPTSRAFDDGTGSSLDLVVSAPTLVRARVTDAAGYEATLGLPVAAPTARPVTIVAVVDNAFSPYHFDFTAAQHPWNRDTDHSNDIDLSADPASYIPGHPGATPLHLTLPTTPGETVSSRATGVDALAWDGMMASSASNVNVYWMPGTKIVGAVHFGGGFVGTNDDHGTRSAASAAGNWHGSCAECLFVLVQDGANNEGLRWAASQPWIDVVTNSYGHGGPLQTATLGLTRDNMYWMAPVNATKVASQEGQTIVFSAGNGFVNAFDVPMFTYWSSEKGPDWMITVGAVAPGNDQTYSGAGKPVDISSIGSSYPSSGTAQANGTGFHSGTSNAAPVTAGYFAKVLQEAREALGDVTPGHAGGVVASGAPIACGAAVPRCALGDGILTRREWQEAVHQNALPSPQRIVVGTVWPSTEYNYYYQGHGVLHGRIQGDALYDAEWGQMVANMHGTAASPTRPEGEANWFIIDSKCRQRLWGKWAYGDYPGYHGPLDPQADPIAYAFNTWCNQLPQSPFALLDPSA